jgi:hypothetical protein
VSAPGLLAWAVLAVLLVALGVSVWWPGPIVAILLSGAGVLAAWALGAWLTGARDRRRERRRRGNWDPGDRG